ncbi:uncharacterized protein Bfra_011538 [Botrytis fragariae]|uniref:Uncharacterized protein n=1 Tax=Botrytis fragariae TaxID=1964551 RepID=A0A8H6EKP0_9HELO|nr:uncharacterized protein Bfra_011538 [Botrytis fragariae]KAF5875776.1 hypothetical protein Bfra_011538 [Botrytis fragariae]
MTEREEDINARHKTKDHHAYREIGSYYKFLIFIWLQIKVYPRFFIQKNLLGVDQYSGKGRPDLI